MLSQRLFRQKVPTELRLLVPMAGLLFILISSVVGTEAAASWIPVYMQATGPAKATMDPLTIEWLQQLAEARNQNSTGMCGKYSYFLVPNDAEFYRAEGRGYGSNLNLHKAGKGLEWLSDHGDSTYVAINSGNLAVGSETENGSHAAAADDDVIIKSGKCRDLYTKSGGKILFVDPEICDSHMFGEKGMNLLEVLNLSKEDQKKIVKDLKSLGVLSEGENFYDEWHSIGRNRDPRSLQYLKENWADKFAPSVIVGDEGVKTGLFDPDLPTQMPDPCRGEYPGSVGAMRTPRVPRVTRAINCLQNATKASAQFGQLLAMNPHIAPVIDTYSERMRPYMYDNDPTGGWIAGTVETGSTVYGTYSAVSATAATFGGYKVAGALASEALAPAAPLAGGVVLAAPAIVAAEFQREYSEIRTEHAASTDQCSDLATELWRKDRRRCGPVLACLQAAGKKYSKELKACQSEFESGSSWWFF